MSVGEGLALGRTDECLFAVVSHKIQCLFSPSESCHLIAGCPSKLWDKLIQHMRDDHCVDRPRHRDSARAQQDHDSPGKNLLSTGLSVHWSRPGWLGWLLTA